MDLENVNFKYAKSMVIKNLDGTAYKKDDDVKDILAKHIINPVRFSKTLQTMLDSGIDTFIEIGPGKTLAGFVKKEKEDKDVSIFNIYDIETLNQVLETINGGIV